MRYTFLMVSKKRPNTLPKKIKLSIQEGSPMHKFDKAMRKIVSVPKDKLKKD